MVEGQQKEQNTPEIILFAQKTIRLQHKFANHVWRFWSCKPRYPAEMTANRGYHNYVTMFIGRKTHKWVGFAVLDFWSMTSVILLFRSLSGWFKKNRWHFYPFGFKQVWNDDETLFFLYRGQIRCSSVNFQFLFFFQTIDSHTHRSREKKSSFLTPWIRRLFCYIKFFFFLFRFKTYWNPLPQKKLLFSLLCPTQLQ